MRDKFKDFDFKPHPEEVEEREAFERGSPPPLKMPDVVNGKPVKADAAPCADCDMAPMGTYCIECKHYDESRFTEEIEAKMRKQFGPPKQDAKPTLYDEYMTDPDFAAEMEKADAEMEISEEIARVEREKERTQEMIEREYAVTKANREQAGLLIEETDKPRDRLSVIIDRVGELMRLVINRDDNNLEGVIDRLDRIEKRLDLWMPGQDGDLDAEFDAIRGHGVAVLNGKTECKCLESQDSGWQSQGTSDETCGIRPGTVFETEGTNEA